MDVLKEFLHEFNEFYHDNQYANLDIVDQLPPYLCHLSSSRELSDLDKLNVAIYFRTIDKDNQFSSPIEMLREIEQKGVQVQVTEEQYKQLIDVMSHIVANDWSYVSELMKQHSEPFIAPQKLAGSTLINKQLDGRAMILERTAPDKDQQEQLQTKVILPPHLSRSVLNTNIHYINQLTRPINPERAATLNDMRIFVPQTDRTGNTTPTAIIQGNAAATRDLCYVAQLPTPAQAISGPEIEKTNNALHYFANHKVQTLSEFLDMPAPEHQIALPKQWDRQLFHEAAQQIVAEESIFQDGQSRAVRVPNNSEILHNLYIRPDMPIHDVATVRPCRYELPEAFFRIRLNPDREEQLAIDKKQAVDNKTVMTNNSTPIFVYNSRTKELTGSEFKTARYVPLDRSHRLSDVIFKATHKPYVKEMKEMRDQIRQSPEFKALISAEPSEQVKVIGSISKAQQAQQIRPIHVSLDENKNVQAVLQDQNIAVRATIDCSSKQMIVQTKHTNDEHEPWQEMNLSNLDADSEVPKHALDKDIFVLNTAASQALKCESLLPGDAFSRYLQGLQEVLQEYVQEFAASKATINPEEIEDHRRSAAQLWRKISDITAALPSSMPKYAAKDAISGALQGINVEQYGVSRQQVMNHIDRKLDKAEEREQSHSKHKIMGLIRT